MVRPQMSVALLRFAPLFCSPNPSVLPSLPSLVLGEQAGVPHYKLSTLQTGSCGPGLPQLSQEAPFGVTTGAPWWPFHCRDPHLPSCSSPPHIHAHTNACAHRRHRTGQHPCACSCTRVYWARAHTCTTLRYPRVRACTLTRTHTHSQTGRKCCTIGSARAHSQLLSDASLHRVQLKPLPRGSAAPRNCFDLETFLRSCLVC